MDHTLELAPVQAEAIAVDGLSHPGLVQPENQDSWLAAPAAGVAVVADGVGGHRDGAAASQSIVAAVTAHLTAAAADLSPDTDAAARLARENHVRRAIALAHERLVETNAAAGGGARPSGATLAGVWAPFGEASFVTVFHVGDSRVYRLRAGRLTQLTRDHSAYEEWRRAGSVGVAPSHKYILQALGVSQRVRPDIHSFLPEPGDRLLICTDGVCGLIDNAEIGPLLDGNAPRDAACQALVGLGIERGGRDNLTAVVCELHN